MVDGIGREWKKEREEGKGKGEGKIGWGRVEGKERREGK